MEIRTTKEESIQISKRLHVEKYALEWVLDE